MSQENSWFDDFEAPFAKGITGTLIDIAKKVGGSTLQVIGDKRKAAKALKDYADKYKSRYGLLKLLGMPKGVPLESVYTPVRFLNELSIRQFESITNLEEGYRKSQERRLQRGERRSQDGITVANEYQYLMVLGNPGAGKSTFLRRMGLEAFKGNTGGFQHNCIPVLLELKQFNTHPVDLIGAIASEFKHFGFPPSKEFATKLLEDGKLLVLLDGLDEVPKDFTDSVMNAIDNLVTNYEKNRFIASCRIAAYRSNLQHDFQVIELADFDDKQIKQFIINWFSSELDKQTLTAEKCWETLKQDNNKAAKELAQTPLLLTFLCLVYNRQQSFPPTRSRLYNKALDILLDEWAAEKRLHQEDIYQGLHTDLEKEMLAEIAYQGFVNDRLFFEEQHLVKDIKDFLADTVDNPKYLDGKKILQAIAAQQGILVERAEDIYSFSHLTLQEYLTAQYISEDYEHIENLVTEHLTDKRWREVFILVAGTKGNADKLLKLMETATKQYINSPKLQNLLVWGKEVTDTSTGAIQPISKRAEAMAMAMTMIAIAYADVLADNEAITYAIISAKAIAKAYAIILAKFSIISIISAFHLTYGNAVAKAIISTIANPNANPIAIAKAIAKAIAIADAIDKFIDYTRWLKKFQIYQDVNYSQLIATLEKVKQQILDDQELIEAHISFSQQIIQIWLTAFHLTPEILDLSSSDLEALDNYLYANYLMIQCKNAAVRVTDTTWSGIESRMLLPTSNQN